MERFADRIEMAETGGLSERRRASAVSPAGAVGYMQIMPETARDPGFGVPDIFQTAEALGYSVPDRSDSTLQNLLRMKDVNKTFGKNYSDAMLNLHGGDERLAAASYNAGPGAVAKAGGVPAFKETQDYVAKVAGKQEKPKMQNPFRIQPKESATRSPRWNVNPDLNFVKRYQNPSAFPAINNLDGTISTHRMANAEVDGKFISYPTIVQSGSGDLIELDDDAALKYALDTGEYAEFKSQEEANKYSANGYKEDWAISEPPKKQGAKKNPFRIEVAPEPDDAEERGFGEELARQIGLATRYGVEGVSGVAGIFADPIGMGISQATGEDYTPLRQYASNVLDAAGFPQPETGMERVVGEASRAVAGASPFVKAGSVVPMLAPLAQAPRLQAISAATSGGSAGIAKESGAGPGGQTLAALAGGLAPGLIATGAAETTRRALRGGEAGRQRFAENVDTFKSVGTTPTVGQASEGRLARSAESLLSRTPGASGRMVAKGVAQADDIAAGLERTAAALAPKTTAEGVGRQVERGIRKGFMGQFREKSAQLYNKLDEYLPLETSVTLKNTNDVLAKLSKPVGGAEETSKLLINKRIDEIRNALAADAKDGAMSYEAVKSLRTLVGRNLEQSTLVDDIPKAQLKQLYGALSRDIEEAAKATGSYSAVKSLNRANDFYKAGLNRIETIERVINKNGGPEKIFSAALQGTKEGASTLRAVMQSLPKDAQKSLSATFIRRMGRANPSNQNDLGEAFSTERFLTNWSSLSDEAKTVLFGRYGPGFKSNMEKIAKVASNLREGSKVYANPSKTSDGNIQFATAGALALSLISGQMGSAATIGSGVALANLGARLLTSPASVGWLAKNTQLPLSALPAQINVLDRIAKDTGDQSAAELSALLKDAVEKQNN